MTALPLLELVPLGRYPYKDSALWFCAANRVNWDYEYAWLWWLLDSGARAWFPKLKATGYEYDLQNKSDDKRNSSYPLPMVAPMCLELPSEALKAAAGDLPVLKLVDDDAALSANWTKQTVPTDA